MDECLLMTYWCPNEREFFYATLQNKIWFIFHICSTLGIHLFLNKALIVKWFKHFYRENMLQLSLLYTNTASHIILHNKISCSHTVQNITTSGNNHAASSWAHIYAVSIIRAISWNLFMPKILKIKEMYTVNSVML